MSDTCVPYMTENGRDMQNGPAVDRICRMILEEADRRMAVTCYQNRNAAIHEVLMEACARAGVEMAGSG